MFTLMARAVVFRRYSVRRQTVVAWGACCSALAGWLRRIGRRRRGERRTTIFVAQSSALHTARLTVDSLLEFLDFSPQARDISSQGKATLAMGTTDDEERKKSSDTPVQKITHSCSLTYLALCASTL